MTRLIALSVGLGAILFFTLVANSIPQSEKHFDEGVTVGADITPAEMASLGEQIFQGQGGCSVCHRVGSLGARAPDLAGIGSRAADRIRETGYAGRASAAEGYLRESLEQPCAYVVAGYDCIMPVINAPPTNLDPAEMALVIAYLQSLGGTVTVKIPERLVSETQAAQAKPTTPQGIVDAMGCGVCHAIPTLDKAVGQVGPDLSMMEDRAIAALKSQDYTGSASTVTEYIRESLLVPNLHVASGCPSPAGGLGACIADVMPKDFGERLTALQLEILVQYLSTLKRP